MISNRTGMRGSSPSGQRRLVLALCLVALLGSACASTKAGPNGEVNPDPWEGMNRGTHAFNEGLDIWAIEPVAKAWDFVMPELVQTSFSNFFDNLRMPVRIVNDILMLRPQQTGEDIGRLMLNSTFGVAGFFDPATQIDIPLNDADFGLTLARYKVPAGPYLVLPFFGPSNVRDTVGLLGDSALYMAAFLPWYVTIPARIVEAVNLRAFYLEEIDESRRTSFDYYVFLRNAYLQNRASKVPGAGSADAKDEEEDIYFYDDEE